MLVEDGSVLDIIYLDTYKRMGLIKSELSPMISPIYGFAIDHVIPKGTIKLEVTVGEHPRVSTVMTEFLMVDCPSAVNGIIERLLLKALNAVTSMYCLTMKFLIVRKWDKCGEANMTQGSRERRKVILEDRYAWSKRGAKGEPPFVEM